MYVNDSEGSQSDASARFQFSTHQLYDLLNLLVAFIQIFLKARHLSIDLVYTLI
jgi:hypothetical protein